MVLPSKAFKAWHEVALPELIKYRDEILKHDPMMSLTLENRKVAMTIFSHDARKFDLTNKAESVMDLLVDAGILSDDNCIVVGEVVIAFGGVDRENPRAEITIV